MTPNTPAHGLVIVYTGDGKGKTTAALGAALRAVGHGLRAVMIQFIKQRECGEHRAAEDLAPRLVIMRLGVGFVRGEWAEADVTAARDAWRAARDCLSSTQYGLVVLDEISYVVRPDVIGVEEVLDALRARPVAQHVVLTGREMPQPLLDAADLVTEMRRVKHPYDQGVRAQPGIEY